MDCVVFHTTSLNSKVSNPNERIALSLHAIKHRFRRRLDVQVTGSNVRFDTS